jgi:hypothetical protein
VNNEYKKTGRRDSHAFVIPDLIRNPGGQEHKVGTSKRERQ